MTTQGSKQYLEVDLQAESAFGPHATQNNGFAAGETSFAAENGSPVWRGVPIVGDGYGLNNPQSTRAGEDLKRNIDSQAPGVLTGFDVSGAVNPLAAPYDKRTGYARSLINWLLGAAINRTSANVKRSYTNRWFTPETSREDILGAMCNTLTVEGSSDGGVLSFNSEWLAASHAPNSWPTPPPSTPVFPMRTVKTASDSDQPDFRGWTFSRAYFMVDPDGTGLQQVLATIRSFSFTVNNNLTPKTPYAKSVLSATAPLVTDIYVTPEITVGDMEISGNFQLDYVNVDLWNALTNDTEIEMVVLARHPQSRVFAVTTLDQGGAPGTDWSLNGGDTTVTLSKVTGDGTLLDADGDFGLFAGGCVMLEDTSPTGGVRDFIRGVGLVKTAYVDSSGDVVIDDGLDFWTPQATPAFPSGTASDFLLYDTALGLRITGARIDNAPQIGGPADIIGQDVNFTAGQTGTETSAFKWIAGSPANPTS